MRTVPTGRGDESVERYDVERCASCSTRFAHGRFTLGWLQCSCAGTSGHRTWYCFDCRTFTYDPPHDPKRSRVSRGGIA